MRRVRGGQIFCENGSLVHESIWGARRHLLSQIDKLYLTRVPSLVDEIGVVVELEGREYLIREATEPFRYLADYLAFDRVFGEGWYDRIEQGEVLSATRDMLIR